MEPFRDDQLIADLRALRPTPRPQFATELDERAAAGFPRRSRLPRLAFDRFRAIAPQRVVLAAGAAVLLTVAIATVTITVSNSGQHSSSPEVAALLPEENQAGHQQSAPPPTAAAPEGPGVMYEVEQTALPSKAGETAGAASSGPAASAGIEGESLSSFNGHLHHRAVERAAEITLAADPKDVDGDASRVFEAVHANNGTVMRSSTEEGRPGEAGATFDLLIPSARLDDAMAAFSEIDAVRSRHESTADITAPTVSAAELLKESHARIDSLLAQLGTAETEEEQEAIEAELRHERRHAGGIAAQLTHLHKRSDFSRVALRIETGGAESSGGGAWGVDDALGDAGHVLTVVAAVTLIALAILGPIALIALLSWLTHRVWVRRERRRVLS
jgi:hypothetical protein